MQEVEEMKEANLILDHYSAAYNDRYRRYPMQFNQADAALIRYVLKKVGSFELTKEMITTFLRLDGQKHGDYWFREQGHNLPTFKAKLDFLYAHTSAKASEGTALYVVGFTRSGEPIKSANATAAVKGIPSVEWEKWKRLPTEHKFIIPKERWAKKGVDTTEWIKTWETIPATD